MEKFTIDPGIYLPEQPRELISPVIQDYVNSGALIQSEQDYAQSISMPGDSITELMSKVETYNAMSRDLLNQPNPEIPNIGPGYSFDMNKSMSSLYKGLNPQTPSLKASARPEYLGSASDLERYSSSDDFQTFGYVPSLGSEQEYRYGRAMSWGDTMGKAFAGGGHLAFDTFMEGWKGWARMTEALFTWDSSKLYGSPEERYQIAKEQEAIFNKYAIYSTAESEDTLLNRQFFGNMLQQSGFTVGALAQIAAETYLTGGLAKIISASAGAIGKAKTIQGAATVGELINDTRKVQQVISNSQRVTNALKSLPRAVVPLYGTIQDLSNASKAGAGFFQLSMLGLGGAKRELSMFNMARSEAIFEAASTYKDLEDKLVNEFRTSNGREPSAEELNNIRNTADRASSDNFYANTGILTLMNRIQFGNMFKNFNTTRKIFNESAASFADEAFEVTGKVGGKTTTKVYEKGFIGRFGATGDIAKTFGRKKAAWEATKSFGKGLMKFEGSEGAQELIQEASNKGLSDYYYDLYSGKSGYDDRIDKVMASIKNPITDLDGAKTFLMGALTGRLIAPFSYGMSKINIGEEAKLREAKKREAIGIINTFYADPTQYLKEQIANVKVQNRAARTMEEAAANQDMYTFYNAKDSAFAKAMASSIKLNMYESFRDTLQEFSDEMSAEDFQKAFSLDPSEANKQDVKEFVGKVVSQMDEYHTLYNNLKDKYGSRIVPELYKYNAPEDYERVKMAKFAQDNAIEMLTTNVFKSRQATKRAVKLQSEIAANSNIGSSSLEVLNKLGSEKAIDEHVSILEKEVAFYNESEELSPEQKKILRSKQQELKLAQKWKDAYEDVQTYMSESYFPEDSIRKIYKAYEDLINYYNESEKKNVTVSMQDIEENFTKFLDYIQLNQDSKSYVDALNVLADPYNAKLIIESFTSSIAEMGKRMQTEHLAEVESIPVEPPQSEEAPSPTAAVLQPNESELAQVQGTARTEPLVTATPVSEADKQESAESKKEPDENAALEAALKEGYDKYTADAKKKGVPPASYSQWKDFTTGAKEIRAKFSGESTAETEPAPKTYADQFNVSSVNTEVINGNVVEQIITSTTLEKIDNFDSKVDDFFADLTTCNL
jgi:hypothetical protein